MVGWGWLASPTQLPFATLRGNLPAGRTSGGPIEASPMDQDRYELHEVSSDGRSSILADVSREMVRLYKEQFGRGPTKARTDWAGPDVLITVLEDTLTPAERNLTRLGEHQRVRDMRTFFQYATVDDFCEPVERLTGRRRALLPERDRHAGGRSRDGDVRAASGGLRRPLPDRHRQRLSSASDGDGPGVDAPAAGRLRRVHALIGAVDQLVGRLRTVPGREADRAGLVERHRTEDPAGDLLGRVAG